MEMVKVMIPQHPLMQEPFLVEATTVAEALATDADRGLTAAEAASRLAADGPNELRSKPPVPWWRKMLAQFQDPLVYLLLVAMAISLVASRSFARIRGHFAQGPAPLEGCGLTGAVGEQANARQTSHARKLLNPMRDPRQTMRARSMTHAVIALPSTSAYSTDSISNACM